MNSKRNNISWTQFSAVNDDITSSFEDLCRLLFNKQFFDGNKNFVSKPNHPGIEIFPVFEEKSGKWISFQSKFFSSNINYSKIKESVEVTIKHHSNDLDIFYLYCNKDINTDSAGYKKCKDLLNSAGIEIRIIANKAIIDRVIENPRLGEYFFGQHSLNKEWFEEKLEQSLDSMGTRYNELFNISTETEKEFNLFLNNVETLKIIKEKKKNALSNLKGLKYYLSEENDLLARDIFIKIHSYKIHNRAKIEECLVWKEDLESYFSEEFELVSSEIEKLNEIETEDKIEKQENTNKANRLQTLIKIPSSLEFSSLEQNLIQKKVLIINGKAGMGKSQLLSEAANTIMKNDGYVILLPGHAFLSSEPIKKQIISYLGLSLNFSEFLDILETLGELANEKVYIFIDAINESNNKEIWKTGLLMLFREIEKLNFVKVAVSLRSGYENSVLDQNIKQKIAEYKIPEITHYGFQNDSIEAIKEFLNHYNIPFSPSYILQSEMTNPLFLTMFCKAYDGSEFDLYHVLENFLEASDIEAQKNACLPSDRRILNNLISEIAEFHLKNETYTISEHDLLELKFWNHYGLVANKLLYLSSLTRSGIFLTFMRDDTEMFKFGYNLLEDFMYAKVIINKFSSAKECKNYLRNDLLKISDVEGINWRYTDTFIVLTNLFFMKFGEECIDIIDDVKNDYDRNRLQSDFVKSFSLRLSQNTKSDYFLNFVNEKNVDRDTVFSVLIENSVRLDNPLNAEFLHNILNNKPLNVRDYLWTTYINGFEDEHDRVFQLVKFFDEGKKLDNSREKTWLVLLLLSWHLTSSNRLLRDKVSKAMIELLKIDFSLCLPLLKKFELVNDPYVIQRLYGIVFGACTKVINFTELDYKNLVEYIYATIFDKQSIYPDILLRDYAKLIIQYFLFKFPACKTNIKESKIIPPYNSDSIPIVEKVRSEYDSGLDTIAYSMAPEGIDRMYGDFGRYVLGSALNYFLDVDNSNIYNYSMKFIESELGYKNDLFGEYDKSLNLSNYNRHNLNKIERIGKKYQWITMYNILARISDHYKLSNVWNEDQAIIFDGSWNPYVRDFDPTLNNNFLNDPNRPNLIKKNLRETDFIEKDASRKDINQWVNNEDDNFFALNSELLLLDEEDNEWVTLDYYNVLRNTDIELDLSRWEEFGDQDKWLMAQGYFVKKEEFDLLKSSLMNKNFMGRWFPEGVQSIYWLFNREFGWSTGYKVLEKDAWLDYSAETGEFETVKYPEIEIPIIYNFDEEDMQPDENDEIKFKECKRPIQKLIAKVMRTSNRFLWEEQYDASQNKATSFNMPCGFLIDELELEQRKHDGYYYDKKGELVVFYERESENFDSPHRILIRKKHLDKFLNKNELVLFWECLGEKRFMIEKMRDQEWSEWSGLLTLVDNDIVGEVVRYSKDIQE
ncbi:ATP-binding protein [Marinilactibacillus piezotolerans]|uniref:ATP-binding protein n=1 Tax=Marinilactibacillus piezotolerans TaxID=258723 RepID=UPI0009B07DD2|nr:ATP-binding protein [Marinilactibacillus piezotolerans]